MMSWEDTIKKNVFDKDPNDMTDFMNVSPRMKREAEKRKESSKQKKIPTLENYKEAIEILMVDYADVWEKTGTYEEVNKKLEKLGL